MKNYLYVFFIFIYFLLISCNKPEIANHNDLSANQDQKSNAKTITISDLKKYGFNIRQDQQLGDTVPPQVGDNFKGQTITYKFGTDLPWTAFTLVLVRNENDTYQIMTQKRHDGTIETAGGHLIAKQSWREGAADELFQEAGIKVLPKSLIFQQGAYTNLSKNTNKPYGNANFFVVFDKKPATNDLSSEIDASYGHQWLDLKATYLEIKQEKDALKKIHGKFYAFFRDHVINFCTYVIDCEKL